MRFMIKALALRTWAAGCLPEMNQLLHLDDTTLVFGSAVSSVEEIIEGKCWEE